MEDTKKVAVYYGSEENGYEEDILGHFDTTKQAMDCVRDNLADDFSNADELANAVSELNEFGYEGTNEHGYHIVYVIGDDAHCLSVLEGLREDFLAQFDDEDE